MLPRDHNFVGHDVSECVRRAVSGLKLSSLEKRFSREELRLAETSVRQFGIRHPLLVDADGSVVSGGIFLLTAQKLGLATVPTIAIETLTRAQMTAYTIAMQNLHAFGKQQIDVLRGALIEIEKLEPDLSLETTALSFAQIDTIVQTDPLFGQPDAADQVELTTARLVSKAGDVWTLGQHRLIQGSATSAADWVTLMQGARADALLTDPPYNLRSRQIGSRGRVKHADFVEGGGEWSQRQFRAFLRQAMRQCIEHSQFGSLHYLFIDWRHIFDLQSVAEPLYDTLVNLCVWTKPNAGMGSFYRSQHELVAIYRNGKRQHRNNVELGRHGRNRSNVWSYDGATTITGRKTDEGHLSAMHPTVKPVQMIADAILDSTPRGGLVADPFLGSGTTLIAAERVGRRCHAIEIDARYVDTAIMRWQKYTGRCAILEATGQTFDEARGQRHG